MDMQHGHGHAVWTWTCSMDMDMEHIFGHAAWIWTMDMHGCRNARMPIKSSVRHRYFSVSLQCLVRHRHFGIMVSPVLLVTGWCPAMVSSFSEYLFDVKSKTKLTLACHAGKSAALGQGIFLNRFLSRLWWARVQESNTGCEIVFIDYSKGKLDYFRYLWL
jgi:hypothetical protein